jgi:glycosyltransferase involved in cell wall biosynthesis
VSVAPHRYRVLFVATHPVQYAAPLFRAISRHPQLDVTVAYCCLQGAEAGYDPEFGIQVRWDVPLLDGYSWRQLPNRSFRPGLGRFFGLVNPGLWSLIRCGRFDAVVFHTGYMYATFWIGFLAAKFSGVPALFSTDATTLEPRRGSSWKRAVKRVTWPLLFRFTDQVLVASTAGLEFMLSLGVPEELISLTPFVVDNDWWLEAAARADRAAVRGSWGVASEEMVVLFCAKLQPWKRPLDLLHAFAKAAIPGAVLVFAGDGPLRERIEAEASALGVCEHIRILGFVNQSQLPGVYSAADLFVLPSEYDPCPAAVCESMLCGCPVVLSDQIRGRFDLVRRGTTGDIFPCADVEALASVLRALLNSREGLAEMGRAAQRRMSTWSPREYIAACVDSVVRSASRCKRPEGQAYQDSAGYTVARKHLPSSANTEKT